VAVIPARDEAARVPAAIRALWAQGARVIVVANGCSDGTAAAARTMGARVIETPALSGGVGEARRIGLAAAAAARPRWLLTTDADCTIGPGVLAVLERALRRADCAFGRVVPEASEFADLPAQVRAHGLLEDRHDALLAAVEGMTEPRPWDPLPRHRQTPGALMAFRPGAYAAAGGVPPVPGHEDKLLAAALERAGARIARPWAAVVHASCRVRGRAPEGMASTIALRTRIDLSGEIRHLSNRCSALEAHLARLGARDAVRRRAGSDEVRASARGYRPGPIEASSGAT
jgi:hypothetical protein